MPVLYISYDGLLEPLGQSQVFHYLRELARDGAYDITLLTFEKKKDWDDAGKRQRAAAAAREAGIAWVPLRYHKRPSAPATAFDIAQGFLVGSWLCATRGVKLVHVRSYVPAVMGLLLHWLFGAPMLFDMRGFWADERVDAGLWRRGSVLYRAAKGFERLFLTRAAAVVSLSRLAIEDMRGFPYLRERPPLFEFIPTCANLELFKPSAPRAKGPLTIGYVGTATGWYLFEPTALAFRCVLERHPDARLLVLNRDEHEYIRQACARAGIPESALELKSVEHGQVAAEMARMDATIFFIKPVYSKRASAPTKLAEFLGCGIPCLGNAGVGDMAGILNGERVGVAIDSFDTPALRAGVETLLKLLDDPEVRPRCVAAAQRHFSLSEGARRYRALYDRLTSPDA